MGIQQLKKYIIYVDQELRRMNKTLGRLNALHVNRLSGVFTRSMQVRDSLKELQRTLLVELRLREGRGR